MSDAGVRVALLARAGKARDQLHRALGEAGAAIVVEGDPNELEPAHVAGFSPTCYLVGLEPAVERSLDRFDELLGAPGVEVMFDDAEVSGKLDGWDLNRWARHIATKLMGRDGLPPAPAVSLYMYEDAPPAEADALPAGGLDLASPSMDGNGESDDLSDSIAIEPGRANGGGLDLDALDLELAGMDFGVSADNDASGTGGDDLSDSISFSSDPTATHDGGLDLELDVAELTAQLEAYETSGRRMPSMDTNDAGFRAAPPTGGDDGFDIESIDALPVAEPSAPVRAPAAAQATAAAKPSFDFGDLTLAPADEGMAAPAPVAFEAEATTDLRLAPISGHDGLGAVVILAGLGGPDAVRQLLASLPEDLPAPVLLYQHLEVGKHERLVDQLAKISKLPVVLAQADGSPQGGQVTLLPAGMTAVARDDRLVFTRGDLSALLLSVPPRESMVVVLSGADPALVPTILEVRDAGGLVLAQDPEVCFDAGAAEALQGEGAAVLPALGLARRIAERWSH
jgi:chemosensory pili system protein ChpB (putative protein-glutamate methylesterase)